jgi:hypothetical protein
MRLKCNDTYYIETAAGQRFSEFQGLKSGKVMSRSSHFGDRSRFADVNYSSENPDLQQTIYINRQYWMEDRNDRKQLPHPLLFMYVGRDPLHEALPKAQDLGKGEVLGRECDVFLFSQIRWSFPQDHVYYLDHATSIPLKVESFRDKPSRDKKEPIWVWTAQSFDKVQGHLVTRKSTEIAYGKEGAPLITWDCNVESIEFDKDYPASTFWPTFQPGVTIFDATADKIHQVPGAKQAASDAMKEAATSAQPIQATPPRDWSSLASNTTFALGCAIVIIAGLLWWRRR